ncbi:Dabb family protein [Devosia sp. CAU 1758]
MIRHNVFVRFRPEINSAEKSSIYADLLALRDVVPGMLNMSYGPNVSPEGLHQGYTDGFSMEFIDEAARDAYLVHPDHKAAGSRLVAALEGGRDGLIVFDLVV